MVEELAPSSNGLAIKKKGRINIIKILEWNQTSMPSTMLQRDVKQFPTDINVLGGIFYHLPSMWASNI